MDKFFKAEAHSVLSLGRDSIKDHTTAIVELVKNGYDADADWVEVEIHTARDDSFIRIADNGTGMSEDDVENKWLRIGFSEKREAENRVSQRGRRKTGEKGVGRLSAARLGSMLELRTLKDRLFFGLSVDWRAFERADRVLNEVPLPVIADAAFKVPANKVLKTVSGTELLIKDLAQEWTIDDLDKLERELSLLVSPFRKTKDFKIHLRSDINDFGSAVVHSHMYDGAIVSLKASFDPINARVNYKTKIIDEADWVKNAVPVSQLLTRRRREVTEIVKCGPVDLTLLFYLQKDDPFEGVSLNKQEIRTFLDNNAGVKIYRDEIRVKPYGDPREPEGDWLELGKRFASNPAGAARESFRIPPSRLVGAVFLTRDMNEQLIDSTSREGLIKGDAFKDLAELIRGCVQLLETTYHKRFLEEKAREWENASPVQRVENLGSELNEIFAEIKRIQPKILRSDEPDFVTYERLERFSSRIPELQHAIRDIQLQNVIFRGLATLGIASSTFGHETQTAISGLTNSVILVKKSLAGPKPDLDIAHDELENAIGFAERIGSWGQFALARVRRDKRSRRMTDVASVVDRVLNEMSAPFSSVGIRLERLIEPVSAITIAMDLEAVLINLLTNSYFVCSDREGSRHVRVSLKQATRNGRQGFELSVADSGPGVAPQFVNRIWEPLFSTRTDPKKRQSGTGLGLSIVDSIVKDFGGERHVSYDVELGGARFEIWFPKR